MSEENTTKMNNRHNTFTVKLSPYVSVMDLNSAAYLWRDINVHVACITGSTTQYTGFKSMH